MIAKKSLSIGAKAAVAGTRLTSLVSPPLTTVTATSIQVGEATTTIMTLPTNATRTTAMAEIAPSLATRKAKKAPHGVQAAASSVAPKAVCSPSVNKQSRP